jgi:hypothetical protein
MRVRMWHDLDGHEIAPRRSVDMCALVLAFIAAFVLLSISHDAILAQDLHNVGM